MAEVGNQRSALYTNLDAGDYTFRVRAANNDGVWNQEGRSIRIIQRPPPWKTVLGLQHLWVNTRIGCAAFTTVAIEKRRRLEEQNAVLELKWPSAPPN